MNLNFDNINHLWSGLIIEELIRNGIDYFCLSPGSRNTPLISVVATHPAARKIIIYDERSAAFHALGYGRASGKPAVLICTSGTALANYWPAVVEAHQENIPLIILSADRPPELRDTLANQTIDQTRFYGNYTRWFFDLPAPDPLLPPEFVLTRVNRLIAAARSFPSGVAHMNCAFREPLEPSAQQFKVPRSPAFERWLTSDHPFSHTPATHPVVEEAELRNVLSMLQQSHSGLILLGGMEPFQYKEEIIRLVKRLNWPVMADITSNFRLSKELPQLIPYFDLLLTDPAFAVDTVLHLGGKLVSKRLLQWLIQKPPRNYIHVWHNDQALDPAHRVTLRITESPPRFARRMLALSPSGNSSPWLHTVKEREQQITPIINQALKEKKFTVQATLIRELIRRIPENQGLYLASSLTVREADLFAAADHRTLHVAANRGASGIDGTVAAASGFAEGLKQPVTLIIGDLALLHDLSSLLAVTRIQQTLFIVVINNHSGSIFHWLPIAQYDHLLPYFTTPHTFNFSHAAAQFNLPYQTVNSVEQLLQAYATFQQKRQSVLIEIITDGSRNSAWYQGLIEQIKQHVSKN